uniref:Uncharacterized protein LOC104243346 n=1 Tax=Nicotiana sylvestris TaxID=4096 RepID=A0A1U7XXW4_NICSY|nr:PREDICTED: uncharacterized protein LOC104243346 [Nicotiana sylvestris]
MEEFYGSNKVRCNFFQGYHTDFPYSRMSTSQNLPMKVMSNILLDLLMWWEDLGKEGREVVNLYLGGLTGLIKIRPRGNIIRALVTVWDPSHNVLHFSNFELTPTLEERAGYVGSTERLRHKYLVSSRSVTPHKFLDLLKINKGVQYADLAVGFPTLRLPKVWAGFDNPESGICSKGNRAKWDEHRCFAFMVTFLGLVVFPRKDGNIDLRVAGVVNVLITNAKSTLSHMIVFEIYRALTACKAEGKLAKAQTKLSKNAEERARFVQQLKGKYDNGIMGLKKKITVLEKEMTKQARDFKAEREHCYIMEDLFRLRENMAQRPAARPTGAVVEALMYSCFVFSSQNCQFLLEFVGPFSTFAVVMENKKVVSLCTILAAHLYNTRSKDKLIMTGQELDASIIDPPREVEETESDLKEELHKLKHQMADMYKLPVGFKMPKFDLYDRHGDPVAHLRGFYNKMRGSGGKDELLMAYFSQSLSGAALEWCTRQDHRRCFRWREQAARINPPMEENEMVEYFLQALESTYLGHLISAIEKCWNLKNDIQELIDTNQIVIQSPETSNINQNPLSAHAETHMIEIVHKDRKPKKPSQSVMMIRSSESKSVTDLVVTKATSLIAKGSVDK